MKQLFTLFLLLLVTFSLSAQKTIRGTITSTDGETLIGVAVQEKGTSNGVLSDIDGTYQLTVANEATVTFSYTGFAPYKITVGDAETYDVTLKEGVDLDEVVITALGISREKKSLTYASQEVSGDELTTVKDVNAINAN
jgi:ferric enterobactin receptor